MRQRGGRYERERRQLQQAAESRLSNTTVFRGIQCLPSVRTSRYHPGQRVQLRHLTSAATWRRHAEPFAAHGFRGDIFSLATMRPGSLTGLVGAVLELHDDRGFVPRTRPTVSQKS